MAGAIGRPWLHRQIPCPPPSSQFLFQSRESDGVSGARTMPCRKSAVLIREHGILCAAPEHTIRTLFKLFCQHTRIEVVLPSTHTSQRPIQSSLREPGLSSSLSISLL